MGRRRKKRTHISEEAGDSAATVRPPKSFVIKSGKVGRSISKLVQDIRDVLRPNTAVRLKEQHSNRLKDFVSVAGPFGVTHLLIFMTSNMTTNLRIAQLPRGPTLSFRVCSYSLIGDLVKLTANPKNVSAYHSTAPLLVLSNFKGKEERHIKLMLALFQNLFPSVDPKKMNLADARRVVLLNYNSENDTVDFRHYSIKVKPVGLSKSVKRVISSDVPDLGRYVDVSEYVLNGANVSESEKEDVGESTVTLPPMLAGRKSGSVGQRAIKLIELGPRMELSLLRIESGLCEGEVLYYHCGN